MAPFGKTQTVIRDATEQLGQSSQILLAVAGIAVVIATIALVVAVSAKVSK